MKISALLCIIMLLSVAHGEDALTFDFATPIILDPILQHMRENLDDGVKGESYLSFSRLIQVIFIILRSLNTTNTTDCEHRGQCMIFG